MPAPLNYASVPAARHPVAKSFLIASGIATVLLVTAVILMKNFDVMPNWGFALSLAACPIELVHFLAAIILTFVCRKSAERIYGVTIILALANVVLSAYYVGTIAAGVR